MNIALNYNHLQRLAANQIVEVEGITLTIDRPILPTLNVPPTDSVDYVTFSLDSHDPRAEPFKFKRT